MEQKTLKKIAGAVGPLVAGALALGIGLAKPATSRADAASEAQEKAERCANRLSVAFLGKSPSAELLANKDPQSAVDGMLGDAAFVERFGRFINSELNNGPGANVAEDATYTLAKYVVGNDKPWKDMFVGKYDVTDTVVADPNGLGYFRSDAWMRRYAGNEEAGYRIVSAYRILQNTTGLELTATTAVEGVDLSATGREAAGCRGCHYESWYALDKVARVLSLRKGMGANMTFTAPTAGPQQILGGKTIANDGELVNALVESTNFKFNSVRLAFKFLYGRPETTCEGAVFDKAVDAFETKGSIKDAISTIAKDATFCQ
jgi:hypothetical protein